MTFLLITLLMVVVFMLVGCSSDIKAVTNPDLPLPTDKEQLPTYLKHFISKEYTDYDITIDASSNVEGSYLVDLELFSDKISEEKALNLARDFVFATFKASQINNLPIDYSAVNIQTPEGKRVLLVGVGSDVIKKIDLDTLKNGSMDAYDFAQWLELNKNQNIIEGKTYYNGRCVIIR